MPEREMAPQAQLMASSTARARVVRVAKAVLPAQTQQRLRKALLRRRARASRSGASRPSAGRRVPESQTTRPVREVDQLDGRLWLGYQELAVPRLEAIATSDTAPAAAKLAAAASLARWHMVLGRFDHALVHADVGLQLGAEPNRDLAALAIDCLCELGRGDEALRLQRRTAAPADDISWTIRRGRVRSMVEPDPGHGSGPVIESLNQSYAAHGLQLIARAEVHAPVNLDNIVAWAPACEPAEALPLVSVIVPAFNAADTIRTALTSLCAQSWRQIEVIVVDDCSTDDTAAVVREVAAVDERVRLVVNPRNVGTYASRNIGLEASRGAFVTVHDADDWSHPQKIEAQAWQMFVTPDIEATISSCIRVTEDLVPASFDGLPAYRQIGQNASSLMFRRRVFDQIGCWDDVIASGDGEFRQRCQARFGESAIEWILPDVALSITRSSVNSLTGPGPTGYLSVFHALGARNLYRESYQWWHAGEGFLASLPYRPDGSRPRPFPAPAALIRGASDGAVEFAAVVVGDLGVGDERTAHVERAVREQAPAHGGAVRPVGLLHVPTFAGTTRRPDPTFRALLADGCAVRLGRESTAVCDRLIVLPSAVGAVQLDGLPTVKARSVYVIGLAESLPAGLTSELERWTGATVNIVAPTCDIREVLQWS